jgi:UDP-2,4-diacetamido-2,4,6-trideoxy-beta-L-altropyranose hydrolase
MRLGKILIRADASVEIGTGHVMRCLALAQAWQDHGGEAVFALAESTSAILARLAGENCGVVSVAGCIGSAEDANHTVELARAHSAQWVVLDGYHFDTGYQERIKSGGRKLLCVDDMGECECYVADLVLNPNLNASETSYRNRHPSTRLLLGPRYALLRREFVKWRTWNRDILALAQRVLITIGGSDPDGLTRKLLEFPEFPGLVSTFVLGGSAREPPDFQESPAAELIRDQGDMAQIMARSDIAVICGGVTLWESLFMGCVTLSYARNPVQKEIMEQLDQMGAVVDLGSIDAFERHTLAKKIADLAVSFERRRAMSEFGRQLVDGRGAERVLCLLQDAR